MKNKIISLLISLLTFMPVYAQSPGKKSATRQRLERQISELETEIKALEGQIGSSTLSEEVKTSSDSGNKKVICHERTLHTELPAMSNQQFNEFCTKELSKTKYLPANVDDHIISSCRQEQGVVSASFYVLSNPNAKPNAGEQTRLSKEKALTKIRNTKKMYQDMIAALNKEIAANNIEIVDNAANLALKHIDLKEAEMLRSQIQELKDKGVDALKGKYGLEGRESTENKIADVVDEGIAFAEELASSIPGGDKVTCHYLWRIFKSTPEIGKMLGNGGATINIMFQRDEYMKKLQELDKREKELLRN